MNNINRQVAIRLGSKPGEQGILNFPSVPELKNAKITGFRMLGGGTGLTSIYGLTSKQQFGVDWAYFYTLVDSNNVTFVHDAPSNLFGANSYALWNRFKPRKINFKNSYVRFFGSVESNTEIYINLLVCNE